MVAPLSGNKPGHKMILCTRWRAISFWSLVSTDHAARSVSRAAGVAQKCVQALPFAAQGASHQCRFLASKRTCTVHHTDIYRVQAAAVTSQNSGCCSHESECRSYVRRPRTNSFPFLEAAAPVLLIGLLVEAIVLQQPVAGVLLGRGRSD